MESFGAYLKRVREARGMTVNQLAMYSDVSAATISRIENGKRGTPKPNTIKRMAAALKVNYEDFMKVAGYIEEVKNEDETDPVDQLIEYLELELTDEEIFERMTFKVDDMTLTLEDVKEFIAFVRAKRFMKSGHKASSELREP